MNGRPPHQRRGSVQPPCRARVRAFAKLRKADRDMQHEPARGRGVELLGHRDGGHIVLVE